ncbi:hypothetical protein KGF56_003065 [Candida oxycetoniae]|uniref:Smr domain-containing protein n=1 Tax=Candida oxycetoniae TaxID=497107 RepID=A0AAI9SWR6_9ASCO|nr:uncharacterized protein KGF56_003065 [Candida oxycetoniae]KAI3404165.2 hypothetical protein KGF56_003065 [Candida oxycetoniae]
MIDQEQNALNRESIPAISSSSMHQSISPPPLSSEKQDSFPFEMNKEQYSELVADETDFDASFLSLVETLADYFPTFPKTEIKIRLKLADNVEDLIEELFSETESNEIGIQQDRSEKSTLPTSTKYNQEAYQLHEIFPQVSLSIISKQLKDNNNDVHKVGMILLNDDPTPPPSQTTGFSSKNSNVNQWFELPDMVSRVKNFLGVNNVSTQDQQGECFVLEDNDVIHYIRRANGNYKNALIEIIKNLRPKLRKEVVNVGVERNCSRVQRGGRQTNNISSRLSNQGVRYIESTYKYNPNNKESRELWQIYENNLVMHSMDKSFLISALEFFRGNCDKVIELAFELAQADASEGSSNEIFETKSRSKNGWRIVFGSDEAATSYQSLSQTFRNYTAKRKPSNDTFTTSNDTFTTSNDTFTTSNSSTLSSATAPFATSERLDAYVRAGTLDLHNFKLVEAIQTTKLVLNHWWNQETKQRIEEGRLQNYGNLALFVNHMSIITGRGIHSVGNVSPIKKYVKEYLTKQSFIFDEYAGKFDVKGKRKNIKK